MDLEIYMDLGLLLTVAQTEKNIAEVKTKIAFLSLLFLPA